MLLRGSSFYKGLFLCSVCDILLSLNSVNVGLPNPLISSLNRFTNPTQSLCLAPLPLCLPDGAQKVFLYGLLYDAVFQIIQRQIVKGLANNGLKFMRKEAIMPRFQAQPGIFQEGLKLTTIIVHQVNRSSRQYSNQEPRIKFRDVKA
jgi:hypothetical protein